MSHLPCERCGSPVRNLVELNEHELDGGLRCAVCAAAARKRAAAHSLVFEAYRSMPEGAAQGMLEHVLACAASNGGRERVEWYAGEAIFARVMLNHGWRFADARTLFEAVRELGTTPSPTRHAVEVRHA